MQVLVTHEAQTDAARIGLALDPLVQALSAKADFAQVTLWPHKGVLICRFVTRDGRRLDTSIGLRPLAAMLGRAEVLQAGVAILLRRAKALLLKKQASDLSGLVLVGAQGQLNPYN